MQIRNRLSTGSGFATAGFAGDQCDAAQFNQVCQTLGDFFDGSAAIQLFGFEVRLKRISGESKMLQIHQSSSVGCGLGA